MIANLRKQLKFSSKLVEAIEKRFVKYFRYDNTPYWQEYYHTKLETKSISREKKYSEIIYKYVGKDGKVLDVGSGMGFLVKELAKKDLNIVAVDLFDDMLKAARKYVGKLPVTFVKADILDIPFPDHSFDCISLMSMLEHFPLEEVKEDILPNMRKLLKKDGYLFVHVPVKTVTSQTCRFWRKYIDRDLPTWAIDDDGDITHKLWYDIDTYIKIIESAGFTLINYDCYFTRSTMKPVLLAKLLGYFQDMLEFTDTYLDKNIHSSSNFYKLTKVLKSKLAVTSYFIFKRN